MLRSFALLLSIVNLQIHLAEAQIVATSLKGFRVVPPVPTSASGKVSFIHSPYTDEILWSLKIDNPAQSGGGGIVQVNLHCGKRGDNGELAAYLFSDVASGGNFADEQGYSGTITSSDIEPSNPCASTVFDLWTLMLDETEDLNESVYIRVDSTTNPSGLIRGDLGRSTDDDGLDTATAVMFGGASVPPVETNVTGVARFVYNDYEDTVGYVLSILNPDAVPVFGMPGAHIHCGTRGNTGGVEVTLQEGGMENRNPEIGVVGEITVDDMAMLCNDDLEELWDGMKNALVYINVHSTDNPSGEIRGQLPGTPPPPTVSPAPTATFEPTEAPEPTKAPTPSPTPNAGPTPDDDDEGNGSGDSASERMKMGSFFNAILVCVLSISIHV